jgi:hypothetical protein
MNPRTWKLGYRIGLSCVILLAASLTLFSLSDIIQIEVDRLPSLKNSARSLLEAPIIFIPIYYVSSLFRRRDIREWDDIIVALIWVGTIVAVLIVHFVLPPASPMVP